MIIRALMRLLTFRVSHPERYRLLCAGLALAGSCGLPLTAAAAPSRFPEACDHDAWRAQCETATVRVPLLEIETVLDLYRLTGNTSAEQQAQQQQTRWLDSPPDCRTPACWSAHVLRRLSEVALSLAALRESGDAPNPGAPAAGLKTPEKNAARLSEESSGRPARMKLDGTQIYSLAQRASVFMMGRAQGQPNKKIFGSGVILAPGLVATNYHVVRKAGSMAVLYQERAYRFSVVAGDIGLDLVLLRVPGLPGSVLPLAPLQSIQPGQRVYAFGSPFGFTQSISDGIVSAIRPHFVNKTAKILQVTAPISSGSSGGGLFDEQGALVGFTTATYKNGQNLNFAIPAELVKTLPPMTLFR